MISTTEKLAKALEEIQAPEQMIHAARSGRYDDFKSESVSPILDLVRDLRRIGAHGLVQQAMAGEFDATKEESEAWYKAEGWKDVS